MTTLITKPTRKLELTKTHTIYKDAQGKRLPGVTTILDVLNKRALIHWAWELGTKGEDYRKVKDKAADVGTIAHFLCECYLKGQEPDYSNIAPADKDKADNAFIKFLQFWDNGNFKLVASELALVSNSMGYGGTLDCVARDDKGRLVLIDLKTSKAIYDEYFCQVIAYAQLWNENHDEKIEQCTIVRIGKDEIPDLEYQSRSDLRNHWALFRAAHEVYKAQKLLK